MQLIALFTYLSALNLIKLGENGYIQQETNFAGLV